VCYKLRKLIKAYNNIRQTNRSDQARQTDRGTDCDGLCPITQDKIGRVLNVLRTN
jgi:hypothetical protein